MSLTPEVHSLLLRPNFAHLSTLTPDGSPHNTPVWIGLEDDRILIGTGESSVKARNARRYSRVALSIKVMDAISRKYVGKEFLFRNPAGRVVLVIEVDKARYTKLPFEHTPPE